MQYRDLLISARVTGCQHGAASLHDEYLALYMRT
jgi:hypothetical protein